MGQDAEILVLDMTSLKPKIPTEGIHLIPNRNMFVI